MNRVLLSFSSFLCASLLAQSPAIVGPPITAVPLTATSTEPKPIDLAICLDISGSMDGLINAARQNLWAVVNDLATLQPTPTLRVALVTFGCSAHEPEKGWVKIETDFTTDLDLVSQKLFALTTNGGEEYVARVLQAASSELQWSQRNDALKLLFVAGNESAAQDPSIAIALACKNAIARGIVVNSIYCGNPADELAPAWREVAKLADGQFAAIEQDAAGEARAGDLAFHAQFAHGRERVADAFIERGDGDGGDGLHGRRGYAEGGAAARAWGEPLRL